MQEEVKFKKGCSTIPTRYSQKKENWDKKEMQGGEAVIASGRTERPHTIMGSAGAPDVFANVDKKKAEAA